MTWLETTVPHAPARTAVSLARRSDRLARAVLVLHNDRDTIEEVAAFASHGAAPTAQRMRRAGQRTGRFVRELAANSHTDPGVLAELCSHERPAVRLAAWSNPATPETAVLAALGAHADDKVFALRGAEAHSALATRASAVVAAHPGATAVLARHPHGAVRSGAVTLGVLDADIVAGLAASTSRVAGMRMNPTFPDRYPTASRLALDALLDGRSCDEAVAAMTETQARAAAQIGAPLLDLALARRFPRVVLEAAYQPGRCSTRPHLGPVALAVACDADRDGWMLALGGQSVSRIGLTRPFSPQVDTAVALGWYRCVRVDNPVRDSSHAAHLGTIVATLGDDAATWELWGQLTETVALVDRATALERARTAAGALAVHSPRAA